MPVQCTLCELALMSAGPLFGECVCSVVTPITCVFMGLSVCGGGDYIKTGKVVLL